MWTERIWKGKRKKTRTGLFVFLYIYLLLSVVLLSVWFLSAKGGKRPENQWASSLETFHCDTSSQGVIVRRYLMLYITPPSTPNICPNTTLYLGGSIWFHVVKQVGNRNQPFTPKKI
jgi:hypothetical protein